MMTLWTDIAGRTCDVCGKLATHYYGEGTLCCVCHGGEEVSQSEDEILLDHIMALIQIQHEGEEIIDSLELVIKSLNEKRDSLIEKFPGLKDEDLEFHL